jgi:photosystem II stability/assembly factor-like uncharacterized protein
MALAVDPSNQNVVYVGTDGGIFKTVNGGVDWAPINSGLDASSNVLSVRALAIDPSNTLIIYAGAGDKIFKSANGGLNWNLVKPANETIMTLVVDPGDTNTIFAGLLDAGALKSGDGGATWRSMSFARSDMRVLAFALHPSDRKTVYAATYEGVQKSTNGGVEWKPVNAGLTQRKVLALALDHSNPSLLYAATVDGLFGSANGGDSWNLINTTSVAGNVHAIAISSNGNAIFAGNQTGVVISTDGGASWIRSHNPLTVGVWSIRVTSSNTLYAGTQGGVFKSVDGGASFSPVNSGLYNTKVSAIAIDPSNSRTIYAVEQSQGVFKSVDGGASWQSVNNGLTDKRVNALAIDPSNSRIIYAGIYGGICKSMNDGARWSPASAGLTDPIITSIAIDPSNTSIVFAGSSEGGVFKSTSAGANWAALSIRLKGGAIHTLKIDPSEPKIIYAAGERGGIFKSIDGGVSWGAANPATNAGVVFARDIALDPARPGTVYAGMVGGVFKSTNRGGDWVKADTGLTDGNLSVLAIDPSNTNIIYAGTAIKGVFRSSNGGMTWTEMSSGLTTRCITSLAVNPSRTSTIYAGTFGAGVFRWPSNTPRATPVAPDPPDRPGTEGYSPAGNTPTVIDKTPSDTPPKREPTRVQRRAVATVVAVSASDLLRSLPLFTGEILLVRHEGKYGAVRAIEQTSKGRGGCIRYEWWYQPDGSGSFVNKNALTGIAEAREVYPAPGLFLAPFLQVGPIVLGWWVGGEGQGWVPFRHPDRLNIVYGLVITKKTDIKSVDAKVEFQRAE